MAGDSELVIWLLDRPDGVASYFCVVCGEMTDDFSSHIISNGHRLNYLARFFPSLLADLMGPLGNNGLPFQQVEIPEGIMAIIAKETWAGDGWACDYGFFVSNKADVCENILGMRHIDESDMPDVLEPFLGVGAQEIHAPDAAVMFLESVDNMRSPDNNEAAADLQQAFDDVVAECLRKNPGLNEAEVRQVAKDHMKSFPH